MKFRQIVTSLIVLAVLALGAVSADAQTRVPRRPGASAAPVTPPPPVPADAKKPVVDTPMPSTGVRIVTDTLPTVEAKRRTVLNPFIKVEGVAEYDLGITSASELSDDCDADLCVTPDKPGDYKLVVEVFNFKAPTITKEFTLHVVPFIQTPMDDIMDAITSRDHSEELQKQLNQSEANVAQLRKDKAELDGFLLRARQDNEALLKANQERWTAGWWMFAFGALSIILLALVGALAVALRKRRSAAATIIIAALVLGGASTSFAQAPPAGGSTPAPATCTPEFKSFAPTYVVAGGKNIPFTVKGTCLDGVTLAFNPEFKLRVKKDKAGVEVPDLVVGKTVITGVFASVSPETEGGYNGFAAADAKGAAITVPNNIGFTVVDSGIAQFVRNETSRGADPVFRLYLKERCLGLYGNDENGEPTCNALVKKPTAEAIGKMLGDETLAVVDGRTKALATLAGTLRAEQVKANTIATEALAVANAAANGTTALGNEMVGGAITVAGLGNVKAKPGFWKGAKPVLSADQAEEERARAARIQATIETLIAARAAAKVDPKKDDQ